jgi:hypothetical protein
VGLLGLWWAWNTYLVGILPTTFLSGLGRSNPDSNSSLEETIRDSFEKFVREMEAKQSLVKEKLKTLKPSK